MEILTEKVAVAAEEWNITEARLLGVCATMGLLPGYDDAHDGLMRAHRRCEAAVVELLQAAEITAAVAEAAWLDASAS